MMTPELEAELDREADRIMNLSPEEPDNEIRAAGEDPEEFGRRAQECVQKALCEFDESRRTSQRHVSIK